jgi:uncharacterized protein
MTISTRGTQIPVIPVDLRRVITDVFDPIDIWLFGSRARGDNRPDSDWDIVVVVEDSQEHLTKPLVSWQASSAARDMGIESTILVTIKSDLAALWGLPNTIGYDLRHEGIKILGA